MAYKCSIFNIISEMDNGDLRLFNSYEGIKSFVHVPSDKSKKIKQWLSCKEPFEEIKDSHFETLKNKGYLVDEKSNESAKRQLLLNDVINSPILNLVILPTDTCNFRCRYCYIDHRKKKMPLEIQNRIIKFARKNINQYTALNVGWFGGEPLEAYDVIENLAESFITICKTARKSYTSNMVTNGYNLTADTFKKLAKLKNYKYQITIDGLASTHDFLRPLEDGTGTFNKIISNLENIRDDDKCRDYIITLRTNFTKKIVENLDEYIAFMAERFGGDYRYQFSIHIAADWGGDSVSNIKNELLNSNDYKKIIQTVASKKTNLNFDYHLIDFNPYSCKCYANLRNEYIIGTDGSVYKCTADFALPENKIGYLSEDGDLIIDDELLARWIFPIQGKANDNCNDCSYSGSCLFSPCPKHFVVDPTLNYNCPRTKFALPSTIQLFDIKFFEVLK